MTAVMDISKDRSTRIAGAARSPRISAVARAQRLAAVDSRTAGSIEAAPTVAILPELLDGGEVVILAIKPSLWFLLFDSARWIALGSLLVVFAALSSTTVAGLSPTSIGKLGLITIAARVGIALLRWVSRYYVLTNRRIMRLCGVLRADIESCPLLDIRNTRVSQDVCERATRLGTIEYYFEKQPPVDLNWRNLARPNEVHNEVRKAIERAIDNQPHG